MESNDKEETENDQQAEVEKEGSFTDDENPMDKGKPPEEDEKVPSSTEMVEEENKSKPSRSGKKLMIGDRSAVPSDVEEEDQPSRPKDRPNNPWARRKAVIRPTRPVSKQNRSNSKTSKKLKTKKTVQTQLSEATSDETDDKPTTDVKQFSFPHYKILSGATVAAVKMRPQKLVIRRTVDENDDSKHWAVGLFQPTKLSLKLRLLRLFLVWLFFRVLNKQTGWLSDKLSIGMLDEPPPPPPPRSKDPSERYIKVFHESSPHPIHVRVRKPPS